MLYSFQTVNRIVHGHGVSAQLGAEVQKHGGTRAVIVTDKGLVKNNVHQPLLESLNKAKIPTELFSDVELDPSPASIERSVEVIKAFKADVIIGLGGGSALDSAKAASLLAVHPGPLEQYFGMHKVPSPCLPTILVPTTAGTGSEVTSISVLADAATNSKKGIVSDYLYAKTVMLDPDLTLALPPYYTAITGLDAFTHAMESFVNLSATPFTDALNIQAMRMIAGNIRKAYAKGTNREARAQMLYAATISGIAFSNTQNGVIHSIGMAVPSQYHLPHGLLMGAIAPMGMAFNAMGSPEKYALVAEILGSAPAGGSTLDKAMSASAGFLRLLEDLQIKPGLEAHGVKREDLRGIAELAAGTARFMDNNPRQGNADALEALLNKYF